MQILPRRLSHCVLGGELFISGMEYVSVLDDSNKRSDYCLDCWEKNRSTCHGNYWKGKMPVKKNSSHLRDEKAMQLFRNATDLKQKFILALYLHGQRELRKVTKSLYEYPETGELFDVEPIGMSSLEAELAAKEIHALL